MRWKAKSRYAWTPCFVWFPKKINDEWVWMERVLRRGHSNSRGNGKISWTWEYVNSELDLLKTNASNQGCQEGTLSSALANRLMTQAPPSKV